MSNEVSLSVCLSRMTGPRTRKKQVFPAVRDLDVAASAPFRSPKNVFLAIDLSKTESICKYIPLMDGNGKQKRVPMHFLGHDTSFEETMWKICEFRKLNDTEQRNENNRWKSMKEREQKLYKKRLEHLKELQKQMKAQKESTMKPSTQAQESSPNNASATNATPSVPSSASQTTLDSSSTSNITNGAPVSSTAVTPASSVTSSSVSTAAPPNLTTNGPAVDASSNTASASVPPAPIASVAPMQSNEATGGASLATGTEMTETAAPLAETTNTAVNDENAHIGLASSKDERMKVLPKPSASASNPKKKDRKRKKALPCQDVSQQADSTAMGTVHSAMVAAAEAIDTTSLPGRASYLPNHVMAVLVLNKVKVTRPDGGGTNCENMSWQREKPQLTVVTSSARDFKDITVAVRDTMKHRDPSRRGNYDLLVFQADNTLDEPLVAPRVKQYVEEYAVARNNPPKKPRPLEDVQIQLANEQNRM